MEAFEVAVDLVRRYKRLQDFRLFRALPIHSLMFLEWLELEHNHVSRFGLVIDELNLTFGYGCFGKIFTFIGTRFQVDLRYTFDLLRVLVSKCTLFVETKEDQQVRWHPDSQ